VSDQDFRKGLRIFYSGGAESLETEALQRIIITSFGILLRRGDRIPKPKLLHFINNVNIEITHAAACGSYLSHRLRNKEEGLEIELIPLLEDDRFSQDTEKVTCRKCLQTSAYKAAVLVKEGLPSEKT